MSNSLSIDGNVKRFSEAQEAAVLAFGSGSSDCMKDLTLLMVLRWQLADTKIVNYIKQFIEAAVGW